MRRRCRPAAPRPQPSQVAWCRPAPYTRCFAYQTCGRRLAAAAPAFRGGSSLALCVVRTESAACKPSRERTALAQAGPLHSSPSQHTTHCSLPLTVPLPLHCAAPPLEFTPLAPPLRPAPRQAAVASADLSAPSPHSPAGPLGPPAPLARPAHARRPTPTPAPHPLPGSGTRQSALARVLSTHVRTKAGPQGACIQAPCECSCEDHCEARTR